MTTRRSVSQVTCLNPAPVTFVGPLPPPVTGMTNTHKVVLRALMEKSLLRCYGWSRKDHRLGMRWKWTRAVGFMKSVLKLIFRIRRSKEILYFPANSGWGMYYDLILAGVGRLRGYRLVLHHHVYSYIDRYDFRMAALVKLIGDRGAHVVYCQMMQDDFTDKYPTEAHFFWVPASIVSSEFQALDEPAPEGAFKLGFLSNLTVAKGLPIVLETVERLLEQDQDVKLILAGPCKGNRERQMIEEASKRWPDRIDYRGAVYGDDKSRFYADIHAFLFPTQYRHESWGIVLTEAMTASRPVIAFGRGCIPWFVRNGCGRVVDCSDDFPALAGDQIKQWMQDQETYQQACQLAKVRIGELHEEARSGLAGFVQGMSSSLD